MEHILQDVLKEMTQKQIQYICEILNVSAESLMSGTEKELEEIYDILCDIEAASYEKDEDDKAKINSDIVTLWGDAIAEAYGYFEEDEED